jgi:hypothetical protein
VNTILIGGGADEREVNRQLASAATLEDLGVSSAPSEDGHAVILESPSGILSPPLESAARDAAKAIGAGVTPVFTYLANAIRRSVPDGRAIPYSLVSGIDLDKLPGASTSHSPPSDAIVLNEWAARELTAGAGDRVEIEYYLWNARDGLTTHITTLTVDRVIPIAGLAADVRLAPVFPGVTTAATLAEWDPPFPLDLSRIRSVDEQYWSAYRTTPKAFISFERARELWQSRYGAATSIRVPVSPDAAARTAGDLADEIRDRLSPQSAGVAVAPVRRLATAAAKGSTDFSEYFLYFSALLVASAILLVAVFFRLGIEQRLRSIGILRAAGFSIAAVRKLLLIEFIALAAAGSVMGTAGAVLYARLIVHGLRTWWIGAVGTTRLAVHVSWTSLATGALAGMLATILCVVLSLRTVARMSPRLLLDARELGAGARPLRRAGRSRLVALALALAAAAMTVIALIRPAIETGLFFGSGAAAAAACLCVFSASLSRDRFARPHAGRGGLLRLGFRSASFRPGRSVASVALIASAVFVVASVSAFRHDDRSADTGRASGTGGFALLARSELPLLHDPNTEDGLHALGVNWSGGPQARVVRFREWRGEDASCLNLYRPQRPTVVAPESAFLDEGRFSFAASIASTDAEKRNPWLLLRRSMTDAMPVIADSTSLEYVLHASVGDTLAFDAGDGQPLRLRIVGALKDSVLQGVLVTSEENLVARFPGIQGYRFFLIDAADATTDAAALAGGIEDQFAPYGLDATGTAERLAAFHRVENTYLSTFQALGGLGVLLGTFGLGAVLFRNILEQRRELAVLRAVGYRARHVSIVMLSEAVLLLLAGLAIGVSSSAIAVAPAWIHRGAARPGPTLALLLGAILLTGLLSSFIATRAALRGPLVSALRQE